MSRTCSFLGDCRCRGSTAERCMSGADGCLHNGLTGTMGVSPPHSSGNSPASLMSCLAFSMLAPSLSICNTGRQPQSLPEGITHH